MARVRSRSHGGALFVVNAYTQHLRIPVSGETANEINKGQVVRNKINYGYWPEKAERKRPGTITFEGKR